MNFKDLINLTNGDNSKIFVVDEAGDVKLVVMNASEFQNLLVGKLTEQVEDIETINKEIVQAQLREDLAPIVPQRGEKGLYPQVDMRSEVIDPSFNFDGPEEVEIEGL